MFRNSWGEEFGHKGYFYVKIGSNALCTEMEALASLPAALSEEQFQNGSWFQRDGQPWLKIVTSTKRGVDGLDNDDGTYEKEPVKMGFVFPLVCGLTLAMYIIANIVVGIVRCVKQRKQIADLPAETDALIEDANRLVQKEADRGMT